MYNGHTHCHKCGQTHWMHGECPARASLDAELDAMLGIESPKESQAMQRRIVDIIEKLLTHTCGELSCEECNSQRQEAAVEIARLRSSQTLTAPTPGERAHTAGSAATGTNAPPTHKT